MIPKESGDARGGSRGTCACGHEVALAEPRGRYRGRLEDMRRYEARRDEIKCKTMWKTHGALVAHRSTRLRACVYGMSGRYLQSRTLALNNRKRGLPVGGVMKDG